MKKIIKFRLASGREPFTDWIDRLPLVSRGWVFNYISRLAVDGTARNLRHVGFGVFEIKIHTGPGYRVYFGERNRELIVLLAGGDKGSQKRDIFKALGYWREYVSQQEL